MAEQGKYILLAGDILPTTNNIQLFEAGQIDEIFGDELVSFFGNAQYAIANLEGPIVNDADPIKKSGPVLRCTTESINGLSKIGIKGLSLANNHIMDYGLNGFVSTIDVLKKSGIAYWGAGSSIVEAKKSKIVTLNGKK